MKTGRRAVGALIGGGREWVIFLEGRIGLRRAKTARTSKLEIGMVAYCAQACVVVQQ